MNDLKFSVLCSLYYKESPEALQQSFSSIFSQTLLPTEVVVVKDGPLTPELEKVLGNFTQKYSCIKVVPLAKNGGLGPALNEGLKHCSYELVARMDTDDIAKPNRFEKQIAVFQQHPEFDVVGAWIDEFIGTPDNIVSQRRLPEKQEDIYKFGGKRCPVNHPVVMFKKQAVLKAGSYQPFPLLEDYYLWVRMLVGGAIFYNIPEALLFFRTSKDMYKRRGGAAYAAQESKLLWKMYQLHYISLGQFLTGVPMRFAVRLMPNSMRKMIYSHFLR